jgi:hypothetical protein
MVLPVCLFIDVNTPEGWRQGYSSIRSFLASLVLDTVYTDSVAQVLGSLALGGIALLNKDTHD